MGIKARPFQSTHPLTTITTKAYAGCDTPGIWAQQGDSVQMARLGQQIDTASGAYTISEILGKGANGIVYLAFRQADHKSFAVKVTKLHQPGTLNELQIGWILALHKSENVVKLVDHVVLNNHLYYVMELCKGGELFNYVIDKGTLPEPRVQHLFHQLTAGLLAAHSRGIAHRDLKLENVLLSEDLDTVKIADFGLGAMTSSVSGNDLMFTRCGSLSYAAPELFVANGYNPFKADVWSLGICLCTMLFSRLPFDVASPRSEAFATFREANRLQKGSVLDEFLACRPECVAAVDVLKACLQIDPSKRVTLLQLLELPWMHGVTAPSDIPESEIFKAPELVHAPVLKDSVAKDAENFVLLSVPTTRAWAGFTRPMLSLPTKPLQEPESFRPDLNLRHLGWMLPDSSKLEPVKRQFITAIRQSDIPFSQLDDTLTIGVDQQISCTLSEDKGRVKIKWSRNTASPLEIMSIYRQVRARFEQIRGEDLLSNFEVQHTDNLDFPATSPKQRDEQPVVEPARSVDDPFISSPDNQSGGSDDNDSGSEFVLFTAPCNRVWSEYDGSMATGCTRGKRSAESQIEPQAKRMAA